MIRSTNLYIRTQWWPTDASDIESELGRVGKAIFVDEALKLIGSTLYGRERPGSTRPVPIAVGQLREGMGWTRQKLIEGQYMNRLVLSNGLDGGAQAGVSGTICEGTSDPNQVVVSLPEPDVLRARGIKLRDVLDVAEGYARTLHGVAVVSSGDLFARAHRYGLKSGEQAAYAAFWGQRIACADPLYKRLAERNLETPYGRIAATAWRDLSTPNVLEVEAMQQLLAD